MSSTSARYLTLVTLVGCGRIAFGPASEAATDAPAGEPSPGDAGATTIAYRQGSEATAGGATVAVPAFGQPVVAGNAMVCAFDYASPIERVISVSDSAGNSYTRVAGPTTKNNWTDELWLAFDLEPGAGLVIRATFTAGVNPKNMTCHEYVNVAVVDPVVTTRSETFAGGGVHALAPPFQVPTASTLIFALYTTPGTVTVGPDFVSRSTLDGDLVQERITTKLGVYDVAAVCDTDCAGTAVVLKAR